MFIYLPHIHVYIQCTCFIFKYVPHVKITPGEMFAPTRGVINRSVDFQSSSQKYVRSRGRGILALELADH